MKSIKLFARPMSLALIALAIASPVMANGIEDQMDAQKTQLRPQHFNYHSDVYRQVTADKHKGTTMNVKRQLDSQKSLPRYHLFDYRSDVFLQLSVNRGA